MNKTTSERLRAWRTNAGLSQEQAAGQIGVSYSAYRQWERSKHQPSRLALTLIERALADSAVVVNGEKASER